MVTSVISSVCLQLVSLQASDNEKLLTQPYNLLVPDKQTTLFWSLANKHEKKSEGFWLPYSNKTFMDSNYLMIFCQQGDLITNKFCFLQFCELCDKDCPCTKSKKKPNCHLCKVQCKVL